MKKLLIAALFVAANAHAGNLMYASNQAGGMLILTDEVRDCPAGATAYYSTELNTMDQIHGCWLYQEPIVYAKSSDGVMHQWPVTSFTVTEYMKEKLAKKTKSKSL